MDIELSLLLVLGAASIFAGFIDAVVGGGGLIQVPVLFTALPREMPATLFGTNKIASVFGTANAALGYARRVDMPWRTVLPATVSAFAFSFLGALSVAWLPREVLRPTILVLLILNLHRTTATRTRRPFVGNLTNIIIGLDRTTTATGRTGHTLGISGITGIMRRLRNRQLRLLEQRSRSMLLDLQLQGRTGSSHATHHATTATTATRGRIGLDRLEFHNIHGMLRRCRSFDLIEALTGIRHNGSSTTRCNRAAHT